MNESIEQLLMMLSEWIPSEASIAITDEQQFLQFYSGRIDLQLKRGMPIFDGSIASEVLKKNEIVQSVVESPTTGETYFGIGYPISFHEERFTVVIVLPVAYATKMNEPITFITGRLDDCWYPIAFHDITYFESFEKKTWFVANGETYQSMYKLKELDYILPSYFLRVHRSYIINVHFIKEISRDIASKLQIEMSDQFTIPVSQTYVPHLRKKLGF